MWNVHPIKVCSGLVASPLELLPAIEIVCDKESHLRTDTDERTS